MIVERPSYKIKGTMFNSSHKILRGFAAFDYPILNDFTLPIPLLIAVISFLISFGY